MIAEPSTLITDYALALLTFVLAWRLRSRLDSQRSRSRWMIAFLALGLAAALGGTYHGFAPMLGDLARLLIWKGTVLVIGVGSAAMITGSAAAVTTGDARRWLTHIAVGVFAIYAAWMLFYNAYIFVVIDTALAMVLVAAMHGRSRSVRTQPGSAWILAAVAVSVVAAVAQASGLSLHRHFNHNDLYHVIQMGAMVMFYAGARRLRDQP